MMPRAQCCSRGGMRCVSMLRSNALLFLTMLAVLLGIAVGLTLRGAHLGYEGLTWLSIWGELFLRMLNSMILPLVGTCLIIGVTSVQETGSAGRLAGVSATYILATNLVCAVLGVFMAVALTPGHSMSLEHSSGGARQYTSYTDIFADLLRNMFPDNIVGMAVQITYTERDITWTGEADNSTGANETHAHVVDSIERTIRIRNGLNTLGLVVLSLLFGVSINAAGASAEPLLHFIKALYSVLIKLLNGLFWYSPIGIFSLVATALVRVESVASVAVSMGMFTLSFVVCFVLHAFVLIPALYLVVCRKNPFRYYLHFLDAIVAGFAATSSAVALPFLLRAAKEKMGIRPAVANAVLPLELMTNKDGSVMFITLATVFVAQVHDITLPAVSYCIIILLAWLLAITVATVPSSSIVILIIVCTSVQIPIQEMVGVIMLTEFLLDRLRTANNVISHGFSCAIIQHFCPAVADTEDSSPEAEEKSVMLSVV